MRISLQHLVFLTAINTAARGIPWLRVPRPRGADTSRPGGPENPLWPPRLAPPPPLVLSTVPLHHPAPPACDACPSRRTDRRGACFGVPRRRRPACIPRRSRTQPAPSLLSPRSRTSAALRAGCGPRPRPKGLRAKDYPTPLQHLSRCPAEGRPTRGSPAQGRLTSAPFPSRLSQPLLAASCSNPD